MTRNKENDSCWFWGPIMYILFGEWLSTSLPSGKSLESSIPSCTTSQKEDLVRGGTLKKNGVIGSEAYLFDLLVSIVVRLFLQGYFLKEIGFLLLSPSHRSVENLLMMTWGPLVVSLLTPRWVGHGRYWLTPHPKVGTFRCYFVGLQGRIHYSLLRTIPRP